MKDPDKMSERELRYEVKVARALMVEGAHEFIYTVPDRNTSPQMCYREGMAHTPMDRWVRCHLVDERIVLGAR